MGVWIINSRLETIIYIGVGNYSYPYPPPARLTHGSLYGGGGGRKARTCTVKMREIMMQKLHFFDATLIHFFGPRLLSLLLIPLKSRNKLDGARCTFWPVHSWTARVNEKNTCKNIHFFAHFLAKNSIFLMQFWYTFLGHAFYLYYSYPSKYYQNALIRFAAVAHCRELKRTCKPFQRT